MTEIWPQKVDGLPAGHEVFYCDEQGCEEGRIEYEVRPKNWAVALEPDWVVEDCPECDHGVLSEVSCAWCGDKVMGREDVAGLDGPKAPVCHPCWTAYGLELLLKSSVQ